MPTPTKGRCRRPAGQPGGQLSPSRWVTPSACKRPRWGTRLRNNILYVAAGYDINVTPDSQNAFSSDYNLLATSGSGQVGG